MLSHYRVLDLTDDKGYLCGKVLADLGADVIKIEPPGGDIGRNTGPFYHDSPHPERSLYWFAYNRGKRSITLNLDSSDGADLFKKLVPTADFVLESFPTGYLEERMLGYPHLSRLNPRLIFTSITPFGQSGPYRDYKTSDLVSMSLGGYLYLTGEDDRPPVRVGFPQAYLHAGMAAVSGSMIAHHYREMTGLGQHVDVSIQEACAWLPPDSYNFWEMGRLLEERHGSVRIRPETGARMRRLWQCKDGYVNFELYGGSLAKSFTIPMVAWLAEENMAPDWLLEMNWLAFDYSRATREQVDSIAEVVGKFFLKHTKAELWEGGIKRRCVVYPVATPQEIMENRQLRARSFWEQVEHRELDASISYPGSCIRYSDAELRPGGRAPLVGEHNTEIYGELGLSKEEIVVLKQARII